MNEHGAQYYQAMTLPLCDQGDNPGCSPALQANTGKPRTHQGDILMANLLSNNSFLMFLRTPEQQLQRLHCIGIEQFKMLNSIPPPKAMSSLWTSSSAVPQSCSQFQCAPGLHRHCDHGHLCGDGAEAITDRSPHSLFNKHELAGIPAQHSIHLLLEVKKKNPSMIFFSIINVSS